MLQADKWRRGELWGISLIIGFHKIETDTSVVCVSARNVRCNYAHRMITLSNARSNSCSPWEFMKSLLPFPVPLNVGNYGVLPHTLYFRRTHKSQTLSLVSVTHRTSNFPQTFFMYQLENKFLCFEVGQHS